MPEIGVDGGQFRAFLQMGQQVLPHAHQAEGAVRSVVEPAEQFLPARLCGPHDIGRVPV